VSGAEAELTSATAALSASSVSWLKTMLTYYHPLGYGHLP
jgi:hypothetical protein